jgi:hypothetical protein
LNAATTRTAVTTDVVAVPVTGSSTMATGVRFPHSSGFPAATSAASIGAATATIVASAVPSTA